jgi:hypothetical protein
VNGRVRVTDNVKVIEREAVTDRVKVIACEAATDRVKVIDLARAIDGGLTTAGNAMVTRHEDAPQNVTGHANEVIIFNRRMIARECSLR